MATKAGLESLDKLLFRDFLEKTYKYEFPDSPEEQIRLLKNLNLATQDDKLNLACVLMFALHPERIVSQFGVKAIRYPGNKIHADHYLDSEDFSGTIEKVYQDCYAFIMRNLHKIQAGQGINSPGIPEIHPVVLEETLVNALIHRDYLIDSQIRIFIYDDRVEIISPEYQFPALGLDDEERLFPQHLPAQFGGFPLQYHVFWQRPGCAGRVFPYGQRDAFDPVVRS